MNFHTTVKIGTALSSGNYSRMEGHLSLRRDRARSLNAAHEYLGVPYLTEYAHKLWATRAG